jgi:hypothetical protein
MGGQGDVATCASCGLQVDRKATAATCLRLHWPGMETAPLDVPAATLADRIVAHGGALTRAMAPDGSLAYEAEVRVRTAGSEMPIRYRRRLLGFAERFGAGSPGILHLSDDAMGLHALHSGELSPRRSWALEDIRSLQTSSSSVQITTREDGVVLFRFTSDSPRRWDELLRHAIGERWKTLGKGTVHEFQPRIRAERVPT